MTTISISAALSLSVLAALSAPRGLESSPPSAAEELLARTTAAYESLQSYADAGTVTYEYPGVVDRAKFRTYFRRKSRDLYFDYQGVSSENLSPKFVSDLSSHRTVWWMSGTDLQRYDFETKTREVYPQGGNQPGSFNRAVYPTHGVSTLVLSLLYSKASLLGTLQEIEEVHLAADEFVGGRRCHKLQGIASQHYQSGARVNVRPITLWIDAETSLVRRLFEGTPEGSAGDSYRRLTITIEPEANPRLDDDKFTFSVPILQK